MKPPGPGLAQRDEALTELMDDPDCDPRRLQRTLRGFGLVNGAVSRWGAVYRTLLRPILAASEAPARVLDIGSGGGDVLRRLARLARRDGFAIDGLGVDPDPRALDAADRGPRTPGVRFTCATSSEIRGSGDTFDLVVSNHVLHHLDEASFDALIDDSSALAERACVHSDIARGRLAYAAFSVAALPVAPGTFLRVDGLRSIRRSYTPAELTARLPAEWWVETVGRFRLLAVRRFSEAPR
ncbi:methyltransferase domain-containing protein [Leucobacter iarius]|uniref:Class I SAM-dependent methyltransferase n=1 Tax=Leucobacter iarius TaxID=333963 RepID=A0ABN2LMU4_9MICO